MGIHVEKSPHAAAATCQALRSARVDLYCDRDQMALDEVRTARRLVIDNDIRGAVVLTWIDQAAWHIRRHEADEAHAALIHARDCLA